MRSRKIDIITNQLASYFGTITKAAFVAEILEPTYDPSSDFFQPPNPNPEDKAANMLLDLTEGGKTINEFLTELEETLKEAPNGEGDLETIKFNVGSTFRVTFEPGSNWSNDSYHINGPALQIGQGRPEPIEAPFSIK